MAEELSGAEPEFDVSVEWPPTPTSGGDETLDASVGRLSISVGHQIVTSYCTHKGLEGRDIVVPLYGMAEWIAANWWALLYEPAKTDESEDDFGFRSRHWLGTARDGFALPDLWFLPSGEQMNLRARSRYLRHAQLEFTNDADASVATDTVRDVLVNFVSKVASHLEQAGVRDTLAQEAWRIVTETAKDEEVYCRLVGSLGLSPYEKNETVDRVLGEVFERLSPGILTDLCEASPPKKFEALAHVTSELVGALENAHAVKLSHLSETSPPLDNKPEAWRWGKEAASVAREQFGISAKDPKGGTAILEAVEFGVETASTVPAKGIDFNQIAAGLNREDDKMRVSLVESASAQKRFAATRAIFLGWVSRSSKSRLVTGAKTREQQASRAFAAEILAPVAYLRSKAGERKRFTLDRLMKLASDLDVSPAVLQYQAQNNQLLSHDYF